MARIRSIKPDFWQDEKLAPLAPIDRLVFLGLISQADDAGRLVDNVRLIDGLLFPQTEDSSRGSLDTLARLKRIIRYAGPSGQRLIQIVRWKDHQKVDNPGSRVFPAPPGELLAAALDSDVSGESSEDIARLSRVDVGGGKKDVGSRSTSTTARVREKIPEADRSAFDALLSRVPEPTMWAAECEAMLDGMGGHVKATPTLLGKAIRDFTANGKLRSPNLRQFRRYVSGAAEEAPADRSQEATRIWGLIKSQGIQHRTTQREIDTEVAALVTAGKVTDAAQFKTILKKLDFNVLKTAQQESYAVKHIESRLNGATLRVA